MILVACVPWNLQLRRAKIAEQQIETYEITLKTIILKEGAEAYSSVLHLFAEIKALKEGILQETK